MSSVAMVDEMDGESAVSLVVCTLREAAQRYGAKFDDALAARTLSSVEASTLEELCILKRADDHGLLDLSGDRSYTHCPRPVPCRLAHFLVSLHAAGTIQQT